MPIIGLKINDILLNEKGRELVLKASNSLGGYWLRCIDRVEVLIIFIDIEE